MYINIPCSPRLGNVAASVFKCAFFGVGSSLIGRQLFVTLNVLEGKEGQ